MKNLICNGIDSNKLIPKEQLINLRGGVRESCFHCYCIDSIGGWHDNYGDLGDAINDIVENCESQQGTCEAASPQDCIGT